MADLLIKQANVNGKLVDIEVTGNKITAIHSTIASKAKTVIDAKGGITIPGFVDAHTHLDKSLLQPASPYVDGTGPEKGKLTLARKQGFTKTDIKQRASQMIERAIKAGTLIWRTNVDVDPSVGLQGIEALLELKEQYKNQIQLQVVAFAQEGVFTDPSIPDLLRQALTMGADAVGGHTIIAGEGKPHIDLILSLAKEFNVEADFHLDESGNLDHYLLPYVADQMIALGLQGKVNGIHCCTLGNVDPATLAGAIEKIKASQLKITVAPTAISTRVLAPAKALREAGVLMGVGTDNIRDFFNPLGSGDVRDVALLLGYVQRFFTSEQVADLVSMITTQGAKLLGVEYGLQVGGPANITVLPAQTNEELLAYRDRPTAIIRQGNLL
jgi:cytosine deaminase